MKGKADQETGPSSSNKKRKPKQETIQQDLYLPPDEDNFEKHGITNLVIKYSEFSS